MSRNAKLWTPSRYGIACLTFCYQCLRGHHWPNSDFHNNRRRLFWAYNTQKHVAWETVARFMWSLKCVAAALLRVMLAFTFFYHCQPLAVGWWWFTSRQPYIAAGLYSVLSAYHCIACCWLVPAWTTPMYVSFLWLTVASNGPDLDESRPLFEDETLWLREHVSLCHVESRCCSCLTVGPIYAYCVNRGKNLGLIEVVPNSATISSIQRKYGTMAGAWKKVPLRDWLEAQVCRVIVLLSFISFAFDNPKHF